MKKKFWLLVAMVLSVLFLVACGGDPDKKSDSGAAGGKRDTLVIGMGADAKSSMFYNKMKGKLEDAVKALNFPKLLIFQPSLLVRGHSDRTGENIGMKVINFLNKLGLFKRYKPMPTAVLAEKMIKAAKDTEQGTHTFTLNKIFE